MNSFDAFWDNFACVPIENDAEAARYHAEEAWIKSGKSYGDFLPWWKENGFVPEPGVEGAKMASLKVWEVAPPQ